MREGKEFISINEEEEEDYLPLTQEHVTSIGITIHGESPSCPNKWDSEGCIEPEKYTVDYLFLKKRCSNCPKRMLEEIDPRILKKRWGDSTDIPEKYTRFFDNKKAQGYYSSSLRRELATISPVEVSCSKCMYPDKLIPEEVHVGKCDLLSCNENLPKGYNSGNKFYLDFKKNYEFYSSLLPVDSSIKEITANDFDFLKKFTKYSFTVTRTILEIDKRPKQTSYKALIRSNDDIKLPPVLLPLESDDMVEIILSKNWTDYTMFNAFIDQTLTYIKDKVCVSGKYLYNIEDKLILDVDVNIISDAFTNADNYSVRNVVSDISSNNLSWTLPEGKKIPCFDTPDDNTVKLEDTEPAITSYRISANIIQISD